MLLQQGTFGKFNVHRVLFCNLSIYFGHSLWNSLSQIWRVCYTALDSECILAKWNWGAPFPLHWWINFPWQVLNHSWDTEDISWGETMWLADTPGELVPSNRPETDSVLWGEIMCVPSLHVLFSKYSFGNCSFAYPTVVHFSLAFFEGLFFQRKMCFEVISDPHIYSCWTVNIFTLTVCALFPRPLRSSCLQLSSFHTLPSVGGTAAWSCPGLRGHQRKHGFYSIQKLSQLRSTEGRARHCLLGAGHLEFRESLEELTV